MKKISKFVVLVLIMQFSSCQSSTSPDQEGVNELEELSALVDSLEDKGSAMTGTWEDYFRIAIPDQMQEMSELNPDAILQYCYVDEVDLGNGLYEVKEHYLLVMMQEKAEIEGYPETLKLDVMTYNADAINAFRSGESIEKFVVTNEPVEIEERAGLNVIKNEITATISGGGNPVKLYYQVGIIEGEKAFYQIFTWCIFDQRDEFEAEMTKIIDSFQEK